MSPFKVVLLDDEKFVLQQLRLYLDSIGGVEVLADFQDPYEFLTWEKGKVFDILISDVDMPGMSGIAVSELVASRTVIFVSGKISTYGNELAQANIEQDNILGYIPKPPKKELLEKALKKFKPPAPVKPPSSYFSAKTRQGNVLLKHSDIQCFATDDFTIRDLRNPLRKAPKGNKWMYLKNRDKLEIIEVTIEKLRLELPPIQFCQVSDSEIVNKDFIRFYDKSSVWVEVNIAPEFIHNKDKGIELGIGDKFKMGFKDFIKQ